MIEEDTNVVLYSPYMNGQEHCTYMHIHKCVCLSHTQNIPMHIPHYIFHKSVYIPHIHMHVNTQNFFGSDLSHMIENNFSNKNSGIFAVCPG